MKSNDAEWTRPRPREPRPAPKKIKPVWTLFYGVPVAEIQRITGCEKSTAYSYKNGNRKPSTAVIKLMQFYNAERILDPKYWPRGWRFHQGQIIDPEGNVTTEAQLRGYGMLMQCLAEWTRNDPAKRSQVDSILTIMGAAKRRA